MTAREHLKSYKSNERRLKQLYSKQITYDYGIGSMDYAKDRVQTSPTSGASYEDEVIRAVDKQAEIEREIKCIESSMEMVKDRINKINHKLYRNVLYFRYIRGMSLLQISLLIEYSLDQTKKISADAVRAFAIKYDLDD